MASRKTNIPSPKDKLTPSTCDHILALMDDCIQEAREGTDYGDPYEPIWNKICELMITISGRPVRRDMDEELEDD